MLLGSNPAPHEFVANGVGRRLVEIVPCGNMAVLDEGVVEVAVKGGLHGGHIFQLRKVPHGDLLLAVARARRTGHDGARVRVRAASQRQLWLPEKRSTRAAVAFYVPVLYEVTKVSAALSDYYVL